MSENTSKNEGLKIWKIDPENGDFAILESIENHQTMFRNKTGEFNAFKNFHLTKENNRGYTLTYKVFGNYVQTVFLSRAQYYKSETKNTN